MAGSDASDLADQIHATGEYLDALLDAVRALAAAASIESDHHYTHVGGLLRNVEDARKAFWLRTTGGTDGS